MTTVNFGAYAIHRAPRYDFGDAAQAELCVAGAVMIALARCPSVQQGQTMHHATPDTAADLLETVTQAITEAAADGSDESLHHAQARFALAAIEAAGFAILPRPTRGVRRHLGSALARAESGSGLPDADGDDHRAARDWLRSVAAVLDRMPEG